MPRHVRAAIQRLHAMINHQPGSGAWCRSREEHVSTQRAHKELHTSHATRVRKSQKQVGFPRATTKCLSTSSTSTDMMGEGFGMYNCIPTPIKSTKSTKSPNHPTNQDFFLLPHTNTTTKHNATQRNAQELFERKTSIVFLCPWLAGRAAHPRRSHFCCVIQPCLAPTRGLRTQGSGMKSKAAKQKKSTAPAAQTRIPCPVKCFFVSVPTSVAHPS